MSSRILLPLQTIHQLPHFFLRLTENNLYDININNLYDIK